MRVSGRVGFSRRKLAALAALATASISLLLVFTVLNEATRLEITHYRAPGPIRARLVVLSDMHFGSYNGYWERVVEAVAAAGPDLVVIAGDAVSGQEGIDGLSTFLSALRERLPDTLVVAVPGNWEYASGALMDAARVYRGHGVLFLINNYTVASLGGGEVIVYGVDDALLGRPDYDKALRLGNASTLLIVVAHEPFPAYHALAGKLNGIIISGHCHGGQVRLLGRPIHLPEGCTPELYEGIRRAGNTTIVISRGLGTTGIPLRIDAAPEIVVIDIGR